MPNRPDEPVVVDKDYRVRSRRPLRRLVFGHPLLGNPLDRSKVLKRFKAALTTARRARGALSRPASHVRTRMAAAGVPMRTLQERLGHRDFATTLIYADYQPSSREADLVDDAFRSAEMPISYAAGSQAVS